MGPRMYIRNISVKYSEENSPGKFQRTGNFGSKSAEFVEGSDSIVTNSLTQKDSIVAYAKEAVSYKKNGYENYVICFICRLPCCHL